MKYLSVCSGIEAASVAWEPLGWEPVGFAEIEPFPSAVLQHHYPDVCNFGDMSRLHDWLDIGIFDAPDLLCGGTPCQAFSIAGLRRSLDDARGNLSLIFCDLANAIDTHRERDGQPPAIIFWENVPGVLNTKDNAFGCFLAGLAGEDDPLEPPGGRWSDVGYVSGPQRAVAWRILDAQYFGLAQRRRRVFVVASARDGFDPAQVLLEFEGVRRDTAPSRETRQDVATTIAGCANGGGANGPGRDVDSVESLQVITMAHGQGGAEIGFDRGPTLTCNHEAPIAAYPVNFFGGNRRTDRPEGGFYIHMDPPTSKALDSSSGLNPTCSQGGTAVLQPVITTDYKDPQACCVTGHRTHALTAEGFDASEDGTGRGNPITVFGWQNSASRSMSVSETTSPTLDKSKTPAVTVALRGREGGATAELGDEVGHALRASSGGGDKAHVLQAMQVRRLTPVECARLQGFPDHYLDITYRGKPAADGPKYKALGNSWAVLVVRWIGRRIQNAI